MAGSITVSSITLDSDNNFSIKSNTGATLFSLDGTGVISGVQNTAITGVITGTQLAANSVNSTIIAANTVSNTAIQTGAIENYLNSQSMNLGMRNRIINGNMAINQRGTTSGITSGYFVDRWTLSGCSTSSTLTSNLPTGFNSGISISATSGNPIAIQKIEAANCSDLSGRNVTLSFYAKNISNATTLYASLAYAGSADSFGSTTTISEQNLGTLTTGWVRYTYTWTNLPSGALNGLALNLLCGGTGTFSMGITGVQLEVGNAPTPFEFRHYGTELALCQRYYQNLGNVGCIAYATQGITVPVQWPVEFRTTPTVTISYSGTANRVYRFISGGTADITPTIFATNKGITNIYYLTGTWAVGLGEGFQTAIVGSAEL
jgi:hypothetical protein